MKTINVNSYMVNCYSLLGLILVFMNKFDYDEELEVILIATISLLIFLPFEYFCSKVIYSFSKKEDFEIKFLSSNRIVTVK
jgi:hypothetical protein